MVEVPVLGTERLVLRGWTGADREAYATLNADPRVMEHFVAPLDRAQSDAFVDRIEQCWRERGYGLWAVERRDTATFVGHVGLWPATFDAPFTPAVEIGWRLAAEHWGHGFATEAARAGLRFGFTRAGLAEVITFTAAVNTRSERVMQRLGMQRRPELDFDHPAVPVGHPVRPHVVYSLTREGR